jgi:hypothetical protein
LAAAAAFAGEPTELEEAPFAASEQPPDLALSEDKLFGEYVFWRETDQGYENGFLEIHHEPTWTLVAHLDRDHDQIADVNTVLKGSYAVARRGDGSVGFYLEGQGTPREFLVDLMIVSGQARSFRALGRSFTRRAPDGPFFVREDNPENRAKELSIESDPAGAAIFVDGEQLPQTTPAKIKRPRAGAPLTVRVALPGLEAPPQVVTLARDEARALVFQFVKGDAALRVTSLPEMHVRLDGRYVGKTPLLLEKLAAGQHTLEIRNDAIGVRQTEQITLEKGKVALKRYRFMGRLEIDVGRHCRVYRFGKSVGETPFAQDVPVGMHSLVLVDDRGERRRLNVEVEADRPTRVEKPFDSLPKAE